MSQWDAPEEQILNEEAGFRKRFRRVSHMITMMDRKSHLRYDDTTSCRNT